MAAIGERGSAVAVLGRHFDGGQLCGAHVEQLLAGVVGHVLPLYSSGSSIVVATVVLVQYSSTRCKYIYCI